MTETGKIIRSYKEAVAEGKKTALATVVRVEGSSYRQPGARMLVTEDGILTGAISGGCLEGDALRKALLAINQKQKKLITYDTSDESVLEFRVQLGCNGIVHILFEYIDDQDPGNPVEILKQVERQRTDAVVVTLFSLKRNAEQIGTVAVYRSGDQMEQDSYSLQQQLNSVFLNRSTEIREVEREDIGQTVLLHFIAPPVSLVIAGAGNDVQPVVKMADLLGWDVTVGDGRMTHATKRRFPEAKNIFVGKPEQLLENVMIDDRTYFVLMTHNYQYDIKVLKLILQSESPYIGILGPKTKMDRMLNDLKEDGITVTDQDLQNIYGPIGLDIGAETSEEIALSVISEIKAVMESRKGISLRYKTEKIHG